MKHSSARFMLFISLLLFALTASGEATFEQTPYQEDQKVVFEFFLDDPAKTATALFWVRSYMNTMLDTPYDMAPEFMDVKIILHGTELVTIAKKNYKKYRDVVERMKYNHALGFEFRVCAMAMADYGYSAKDLQDFIVIAPSAMAEIAHWQQQGYALIRPLVYTRTHSVEDIR